MKNKSVLNLLYLLKFLSESEYSKNDLLEKFKKENIILSKTSLNNYIKKIKSNNISISQRLIKNKKYYSIDRNLNEIDITDEEISVMRDTKSLFLNEKNPDNIRYIMRAFYKFALSAKNQKVRSELADFGYWSKINWNLVRKLNLHCKNKDIIEVDYLIPEGNKNITIHVDSIKAGNWSERLYLQGVFENDDKISQLPIDKIYMIKKVVKKNVRFDMTVDVLTYKISKKAYEKADKDEKEKLSEIKNNIVTIKRPLEDSFFVIQRLLYFCPDLYYISDNKIKTMVKEKLFILKDSYGDRFDK